MSELTRGDASELLVEVGSGDIFADLGFADSRNRQQKATVANRIEDLIDADGATTAQAAEILGAPVGDISDIVRGRLVRFDLELLFQFFTKLLMHSMTVNDRSLEVTLRPSVPGEERILLHISGRSRGELKETGVRK